MAMNPTLIGSLIGGRYRVQQRRGTGAHGIVVDATDEQENRQVAIKILRPQYAADSAAEARFRLEAQTAASMSHPNLNAVFDWGVEEIEGARVPFVVLELLAGGSLRDMIDRGRLLSPSQALVVGLDVCRGLDYMHRLGVIHRDIKPASLAFGDDRHLRILDVGLSRLVAEQTWAEPTAAGLDAARYASPEEARGGRPEDGTLTAATDIYSLALTLIEAVTGQVPFASDSTVATLNARLDKLMPVSADFGPLASVLSRAGSAVAADRFTAAEFGRALVQAAEKLPRPAPLPIVGAAASESFGDRTGEMATPPPAPTLAPTLPGATRPDPTGPLQRPPLGAAGGVTAPSAPLIPPPLAAGQTVPQTMSPAVPPSMTPAGPSTMPPAVPPTVPAAGVTAPASPFGLAVAPPSAPSTVDGLGTTSTVITGTESGGDAQGDGQGDGPINTGYDPNVEYKPPRKRIKVVIALVLVLAALGAGAFVVLNVLKDESYAMPELGGLARAVAENKIAGNDWEVVVETERSETVPVGNVIRTDPVAGIKVKKGGTVTFVVSDGPPLSVLPDVTGQPLEAATAQLEGDSLGIAVADSVYDEAVPAGSIISWSVPAQPGLVAGAEVMPNTVVVSVVVSLGPEPRVVPNLLGLDLTTATSNLAGLQLLIVQDPNDTFSNDYPAGVIGAQSVPEGTSIERGGTVTVALSKGPDYVYMPPLAGLTYDQIVEALTAAGLGVGNITGDKVTQTIADATFEGVSVVPNQQFIRGTLIDLVFM